MIRMEHSFKPNHDVLVKPANPDWEYFDPICEPKPDSRDFILNRVSQIILNNTK